MEQMPFHNDIHRAQPERDLSPDEGSCCLFQTLWHKHSMLEHYHLVPGMGQWWWHIYGSIRRLWGRSKTRMGKNPMKISTEIAIQIKSHLLLKVKKDPKSLMKKLLSWNKRISLGKSCFRREKTQWDFLCHPEVTFFLRSFWVTLIS